MRAFAIAVLCVTACSTALCPDLRAQKISWSLPDRGAAIYQRQVELKGKKILDSRPDAKEDQLNENSAFGGRRSPAMVLDGEMDRRKQFVAAGPYDVRDIACLLAMDLRHPRRGRQRLDVPQGDSHGPITVLATYQSPSDDGSQAIAVELRAGEPDPERAHLQVRQYSGTMTIARWVDAEAGRVASFVAECTWRVDYPPNQRKHHGIRAGELVLLERWTFDRLLDAKVPEFRTRVREAIVDGVDNLRGKLKNPAGGSFTPEAPGAHAFGSGELALVILAALKGGLSPRDELLAAALDELRRREIHQTYSLSTAIMALEALYTPSNERDLLLQGAIDAPIPRRPSEADLALLQEWTERLLGNIDTSVDPAYLRRWHYLPSKSFDNSNTQYALLGLYAATLCGVEVSAQVWFAAAKHWIDVQQESDGKPTVVGLVSHRDLEKQSDGRRTAVRGPKVKPAGWSYGKGPDVTGSMTSAGITGLIICEAALRGQKRGTRKLFSDMRNAVNAGFGWFAENLTVRVNPRPTGRGHSGWHYYYLYGLERACELSHVALIQGRDWYFEGALLLLEQQHQNGSWGGTRETCFAILFLKKAALPAVTGRGRGR